MTMDNVKEKGKEFFIGFRNTMGDIAERAEKTISNSMIMICAIRISLLF